MSNASKDIKKSNFTRTVAIPAGATFDYVSSGTNKNITFENMVAEFGTIGTLVQKGDPAQTPILNINGTINEIRNLEDGAGVKASLSVNGGAQLDHNFGVGTAGIPVLGDITLASPVIRNIVAGAGIGVALAGKNIQISATGITVASNIVIVNAMTDFPTAVAGGITLNDDTAYLVSATLTTSNRFVLGNNTVLYAADSNVGSLTYTGTGVMITTTADNSKVTLISLTCATGQLLDISSTSGNGIFQLVNATVTACDTIGTIGDMNAIQITDVAFNSITTDGLTFSGNINVFIGDRNLFVISAGTVFDLGTAVFSAGWSLGTSFAVLGVGTVFLSGLAASGNIPESSLGTLINNRFSGAGVVLNGITVQDSHWEFTTNDGVSNSINSLLCTHAGATLTIAAAATPVKIGATWLFSHSSRFSGNADGTFTFDGKSAHLDLHASITADIPTGIDNLSFFFYVNGVKENLSSIQREFNSGNDGNISMVWQVDLVEQDIVELWCQNDDTSVNIIIRQIILGIS